MLLPTGCTLDAVSYTEKTNENFPTTADDVAQSLAGIYQNLNQANANAQMTFYYISVLASDDNLGGGGTNDKLMQAVDLLCNYQQDMTHQFWIDRYQGISRANDLLSALETMDNEDGTLDVYKGEALFLRAFYYYELCSQYGNVPLVLEPTTEQVPQATAAEAWGQILQDLRDAIELMPDTRRTDGHVDKYGAEAMLGRAWLFYTGMYGNGEELADLTSTSYNPLTSVDLPDGTTMTKDDVIAYIDDCVDNSGYSLVSDYRNLWAYTNRCTVEDYYYTTGQGLQWVEDDNAVNPESLFAIKFNKLADWSSTIGYANIYALQFGVRGGQDYANTFPFGQGWGAGPVAPNLVSAWEEEEPGDMRLEASIQDVNELPAYTFGGWSDFVQETDYHEKKLSPVSAIDDDGSYVCCFENLMYGTSGWDEGSENMQLNNIRDLVLIRFADVLLMQSELKEEVSGINQVRTRAGLPSISSYSLEALQNERRWELAFEGTRWNDIRRWHIAAEALEEQTGVSIYYCGSSSTNTAHNGGYAARYNATAGFFKIPESEISLSGGTLQQDALSERLCIGTEGAPDHFGTGFDPDAIVIEQSICSNGKKGNSLTITANTNPVLCTFNWGTGSMDTNVGKLTYYGLGEDIELTVDILAADGSAHTYSLGTYTAEDYSDLPEAITQITGWHPEDSPTGTKTWQLSVDGDQWGNGQYGSLSTWWTTTVESQGGSTGTMTFDYAAGTLTKVIDDETNERGDCSGSGTFSLDFSTATDDIVCTLETGGESNIVFPYLINEDYAETRTFQVVSLTDNELWLCAQHIDPSASADEGTFWHFQAVTEE